MLQYGMSNLVDAIANTVEFNVQYKIETGELTPRTAIRYLREAGKDPTDFGGIPNGAWRAGLGEVRRRIQAEKRKAVK